MGSEERQAVVSTEEDQREGREVAVANFDPCRGLVSSGAVSQDHRDLSVRSDSEAGRKRGWKLAEGGSGVHETFHRSRRLIAGSRWTDVDLN
jgi:hypothetical protein